MIRAVVFDWAGTMIDFGSRAPVVALLRLFEGAGVPITEAEARADMGRAKRDHIGRILAMPRVADAWVKAHGARSSDADADRLHDAVLGEMQAAARATAVLIPGAAALVQRLRAQGVGIGSSTGYTREGRPSPLMLWRNLVELGAWPASACVKVDDAAVGIAEGRGGGTWTVGVTASGNGVGLAEDALAALPPAERSARIAAAGAPLLEAGAHYLVETVAALDPVLAEIAARIAAGDRPG